MKKIFQKIVDPGRGDCMQATFASLFDMELEEVPPFIEFGDEWFKKIWEFIRDNGYEYEGFYYNGENVSPDFHITNISKEEGINGLFYATVNSPKFHLQGGTHAIIVDKNLNIVHDPNPAYKDILEYPYADELGYHGIKSVMIINKKKQDEGLGKA